MDLLQLLRHGKRIRTLGVDDGPFEASRHGCARVLVVGAVYSGDQFDGLLTTHVRQDGFNATDRLVQMIQGSKFQPQLHLVLLDGITLGGFNIVDLPRLSASIGLPCVAVMRRPPRRQAMQRALVQLSWPDRRARTMARAGVVHPAGELWFQVAGLDPQTTAAVLLHTTIHGNVPEPLRAAHLIARGVVCGESGKRA